MEKIRSLSEKIEFVHSQIKERGLSIHPQSRLAEEARVFFDESGQLRTVEFADPLFHAAAEALRDFTLFEFILEGWPFGHGEAGPTGKLRASLKDAVDPYAAAKKTQGRDTQLELFVAVSLHRAGLPVELTSPDVKTQLDGVDFFVEAKRPKSREAIADAVRSASRQVKDSGRFGSVFLDVSLAFTPSRAYVTRLMPDDEFLRLHREGLRHGIGLVDAQIAKELRGKPVVAVCFQDHQLRHYEHGWKLESCCMVYRNPAPQPDTLASVAKVFEETLNRSWPR